MKNEKIIIDDEEKRHGDASFLFRFILGWAVFVGILVWWLL